MGDGERVLRMGMVGGGQGAFIGAIHRTAACMDGAVRLSAGALSSTPERARASGRALGLEDSRNYANWKAMLEGERRLPAGERVDFVSIVTPNDGHFEPAAAFVGAGFHVVCDKPMVTTPEQARELEVAVGRAGVVFCVTYNYSGYPMVKQAREMVRAGELGEVRKVVVEYNQGWLTQNLAAAGHKQAAWRADPARSGGGAIADIGTHAEHLMSYTSGLEIDSLCADLTSFVPGRQVDDDASLLIRFKPVRPGATPARGTLAASQVQVGHENDLWVRIHGTKGSLEWRQEQPNELRLRSEGKPEAVLRRGNAYLGAAAAKNSRTPPGHPEGFLDAFGNVYRAACDAIRSGSGGPNAAEQWDFPGIDAGARGVRFVQAALESSRGGGVWTPMPGIAKVR